MTSRPVDGQIAEVSKSSLMKAAVVRRIRSGRVHQGEEKPEVIQQAQPIGRADCQMAAQLFCYSSVGVCHLSAAYLKRWATKGRDDGRCKLARRAQIVCTHYVGDVQQAWRLLFCMQMELLI